MALPIYTFKTVEEARQMLVMIGSLSLDGDHYYLAGFSGEVDDLFLVSEKIYQILEHRAGRGRADSKEG